jgi:tRNA(Ile)-lysidine synthetase-like protein
VKLNILQLEQCGSNIEDTRGHSHPASLPLLITGRIESMEINIKPGRYVVAVSGGVDSTVLLDILNRHNGLELIVAHFNHGIRVNSTDDENFVRQTAANYGLPFEVGYGKLGYGASEADARHARYAFLKRIKQKHEARLIITAHHQDDLIETALINIMRGTGPKGLTAISSNEEVFRPLLNHSKAQVLSYATGHKLQWIEDSTNRDNNYLRNYARNVMLTNMNASERNQVLAQLKRVETAQAEIENIIAKISHKLLINNVTMSRSAFISLPSEVGNNILISWMSSVESGSLDRKTVHRLANAIRTAPAGSSYDVRKGSKLLISKKEACYRP